MHFLSGRLNNTMILLPVCQQEVINEINKLANSNVAGIDNFPFKNVKLSCNFTYKPLPCDLSFSEAIVPRALKLSKVIPVFKKLSRCIPSNSRPVSLINVFNKIIEKLMLKRLLDFLDRIDVLSKYQFGFRKDHSTTLVIIEIIENTRTSLENGDLVAGVYIELSKAFDTVDHEILLYRLDYYGIRGHVCKWFRHYLSDTQRRVSSNGTVSEYAHVQTGVSQGTILGPVLFLLQINDIYNAVDNVPLRLFADDNNLFISVKDINDIVYTSRYKLESFSVWFQHNQL